VDVEEEGGGGDHEAAEALVCPWNAQLRVDLGGSEMRRRQQLPDGRGEIQPRTCIVTFASVWMYTSSLPALLSGESSSIMRHWWQMSGRYSAAFLLFFFRMCAWSSLFSSWKLWPALTVSRLARSSTTIRRCAVSFSRPLAGRGAVVAMSRAARSRGVVAAAAEKGAA
jgi:hypothetical protein